MTVATNLNRKEYAGNGVTTAFSTNPVVFFEEGDLDVYVVVDATGAATLKTIATHYTVAGGDGATGTVTMLVAPAVGETLVIVRNLDIVQETDLVNNDGSDAEVLEGALDRGAMIMQQIDFKVGRSFRLPDSDVSGASTELPVPEAGTVIGWDEDAEALVNYEATDLDLSLVSTYFGTLIGVGDADELFQEIVDGATAETAPAIGDVILLSDVSLTPDDGRKMTLENVMKVVGGLTEKLAPVRAADYVLAYSAADSAARKLLLDQLPLPRSYLAGGALANGADATNDINVTAGEARDSTNTVNIRWSALAGKQLDAAFAAGASAGMRSAVGAISDATWFIYAIRNDTTGAGDILADTSATAPTMPAGYTYFRRIGAVLRASGSILAFTQLGDDFYLTNSAQNSTSNPGTTDTPFALTVPIGIRVKPYFHVNASVAGTATGGVIRTPDIGPTETPGSTDANANFNLAANGTNIARLNFAQHELYTNTSGQINIDLSASAGTAFEIRTYGWQDRRGRDD